MMERGEFDNADRAGGLGAGRRSGVTATVGKPGPSANGSGS